MGPTQRLVVCACALLLLQISCKRDFDSLGVHINLDARMLKNGLSVIMVPDPSVPVVSYQSWVKVGSVDEEFGKTGLAHLFEHLMFKGTDKIGPKEFFQRLEVHGAEVNAFTTRDYTVYHESFAPSILKETIELEADRLAHLKLTDEALKTELMVVLEERKLRTENSVGGKIQEALWSLSYARHPYGRPVIGYPEDLLRLNVDDLKAFFKKYYQPSNMTIVIAGQFDPDEAFTWIKQAYGSIEGRQPPKREIEKEPEQKEERRLVLRDSTASEQFSQAYHITSAQDDDSYAMDVLSNILFEGTESRAYRRLVDELDLCASIDGSSFTPTFDGLLMISGTMKGNQKSEKAESELLKLISDLQKTPPTKEEVDKAVKQLTVQLVDSIRTPHGLAQFIGTVATVFGDPERFADDVKKYLSVTPEDVRRVAQKYLINNNRTVITMVPEVKK